MPCQDFDKVHCMPICPTPMYYQCPACHWSKTVAPRSDALGPCDFYSDCPQCQHSPLQVRPAGVVQGELAQVAHTIARLWRSRR